MNKQGRTQNKHLFPKGVSGNPAGRPKGSKNKTTLMKEGMEADWLSFLMDEDPDDEEKKLRWQRLMEKVYARAIEGDAKALQLIMGEVHKDLRNYNNIKSKEGGGPRSVSINIKTKDKPQEKDVNVIEGESVEILEHTKEEKS